MSAAALLIDPLEITAPATFDAVIVNHGERILDYGRAYTIEHWDGEALLHCAKLGQAGSLIRVGQIARVSSSKAAWTRRLTVSSVPSS
jgi:hypothetical protein